MLAIFIPELNLMYPCMATFNLVAVLFVNDILYHLQTYLYPEQTLKYAIWKLFNYP